MKTEKLKFIEKFLPDSSEIQMLKGCDAAPGSLQRIALEFPFNIRVHALCTVPEGNPSIHESCMSQEA